MQKARISLAIRSIHPNSVYREKVYTQIVEVSAQSKRFRILDSGLLISDKYVGQELDLELITFSISQNQRQVASKRRIETNQDFEVIRLLGDVLDVDNDRGGFLLDVGIGTILCDGITIEGNTKEISVGDFVVHNPRRIDLASVYL